MAVGNIGGGVPSAGLPPVEPQVKTKTTTAVSGGQTGIDGLDGDYGAVPSPEQAFKDMGLSVETGALASVEDKLGNDTTGQLKTLGSELHDLPPETVQDKFSQILTRNGHAKGLVMDDVGAIILMVMMESYKGATEDLKYLAAKVKHNNDQKRLIREHLADVRDWEADFNKWADSKGIDPSDPTPDEQQQIQEYFIRETKSTSSGENIGNISFDTAFHGEVDEVVDRADAYIEEHFGPAVKNMPPEIEAKLKAALLSGDPGEIAGAFEEFAQYMAFLGDANAGGGGYDDTAHSPNHSKWSYGDFEYYMESPVNETARGNLADGDIKNLEAAFGFPEGLLSGDSDFENIVASAMSPMYDSWQNTIKYEIPKSSQDILQEIMADPTGPRAIEMYGSAAAAEKALKGMGYDPDKAAMRNEIGISDTIPPAGVTTAEQLGNYKERMEDTMNTLGEDGQTLGINLQQGLQRMQQSLQTVANVTKLLHDSALAIIRKI